MPKFLAHRLRRMPRPRRDIKKWSIPTRDQWDRHWERYVGPIHQTYRIQVPDSDVALPYGLRAEYDADSMFRVTGDLAHRAARGDDHAAMWACTILRVLGFDWVA